jgi:O-antigen/teichoic acid export membrane protein
MADQDVPAAPRSLLWVGLEALSLSAVSFIVLAALARNLDPEAFGRAATALSLVQIACSIVEALFCDAIVQRRDLTPAQQAAAHTLGSAVAVLAAAVLGAWGLGANNATDVAALTAWMAPSIVFTGLSAVPLAMLRRSLALREVALLYSTARLLSGAVAVALLAGGAGVWGLVAHQNLSALVLLLGLQWRGHAVLRGFGAAQPARALLRFALVNSLHGLLTSNRARLFQLMSALVMPAHVVGQLALALRLVEMLAAVVVTGVARAALVHLAELVHTGRDAAGEFLALTRRFSALATPVFVLLAALALPVVQVVGDRAWVDAAGLVCAFALAQALRSPVHLSATLFAAHGKPQLNVLVVTAELLALTLLVLLLRDPMAWVWRLAVALPLTLWWLRRMGVPTLPLLRAVRAPWLAALGMWLLLSLLLPALRNQLPVPALLVIGAVVGAAGYAALLSLTWRGLWNDMRALARL